MSYVLNFAIADCAARLLAQERTKNHPGPDNAQCRRGLRREPVIVLRHLWKTGDAGQRGLVAARVAIWTDRPADRPISKITREVREREARRLENKQQKGA